MVNTHSIFDVFDLKSLFLSTVLDCFQYSNIKYNHGFDQFWCFWVKLGEQTLLMFDKVF